MRQPSPGDLQGYVSSDGGGRVRRFGCLICGIDFRRCNGRTKWKRGQLVDRAFQTEAKSSVLTPSQDTGPAPTCVRQPALSQFDHRPRTGSGQKHRHSRKTGSACCRPSAVTEVGLPSQPSWTKSDPNRHQHRAGGRPEPEMVSLSHYYRRHHHRARNHSRAMRQVAEWIENSGVVNSGTAEDAAVVRRRRHPRRHIHEHRHHHYHYHYSVSGVV